MNNFDYKNMTPFKWFVLENFPFIENDFEAINNYRLFSKVVEYLNKTIDNVNVLGNLVEQFSNYFDNLDVQDEINNKLDEMVEQGILQEIIADYLNSKAIFGFDTVNDMKQATNLIDGSYAKTLGFYTKNDGGMATYKIRTITNNDIIDERKIIAINNNLIAELIINDIVNVLQQGVINDGVTDTTNLIQNVINSNPNKTLFFPSGVYLVSNSIYTPAQNNLSVKLLLDKYAIIKASSNYISNDDYMIMLGGIEKNNYTRYSNGSQFGIEGGVIDCNNVANGGIEYNHGVGGYIKNCEIRNCIVGINIPSGTNNGSNDILMENIDIYGDNSTNSKGIIMNGSDNFINNIRTFKTQKGIICNRGGNHYINIHCLYSNNDLTNYNDSIGFEINSAHNTFDYCYSDQFSIAFLINNNGRNIFRSAWAYYYQGGNYNHIAFKFNDQFSAIIDDLYVAFADATGTNKALDISSTVGGGKLRNLRFLNENYLSSSNDKCFLPYYNKDYLRKFNEDLTDVAGTIENLILTASNNMINLNFKVGGLTVNANTNQVICKLPEGFYNPNMAPNLIALIDNPSLNKKFNCWLRSNGEIVLNCNDSITSSNKITIQGVYCI